MRNATVCGAVIALLASACYGPDAPVTGTAEAPDVANRPAPPLRRVDTALTFEANLGQCAEPVRYLTRAAGVSVFFTDDETVFALAAGDRRHNARLDDLTDVVPAPPETPRRSAAVRMQFVGGADDAEWRPLEEQAGRKNYFVGRDATSWTTDVPTYRRVTRAGVYPGIDAVWYGNGRMLEYDLVVAPGVDPGIVRIGFSGHDSLAATDAGDLVVSTVAGDLVQHRPRVWQDRPQGRVAVPCSYRIESAGLVCFDVGDYDRGSPLVIDPTVAFITYLGGDSFEQISGTFVGDDGSVYVAGYTLSLDFPETPVLTATEERCFVTKFLPDGSDVVFTTELGPMDGGDGWSLYPAVDAGGNVYVAGWTHSEDFPLAGTPVRSTLGGMRDAFVTKMAPDGASLVYSTLLGGDGLDDASDIAVLPDGSVVVVGATTSTDFDGAGSSLIQATAPGGPRDAFVARLNAAGDGLVYSTYLGTPAFDRAFAVDVDSAGAAYVVGRTDAAGLPGTGTSPIRNAPVGRDGFLLKVAPDGSDVVFGTYLGGSGHDNAFGVAVTAAGEAVVGSQSRSADFVGVGPGSLDSTFSGSTAAAVTRVNAAGDGIVWSTFVGQQNLAFGVALDGAGNTHVAGLVLSGGASEIPIIDPVQAEYDSPFEGFVVTIDPDATAFLFGTYLGGNWGDAAWTVAANAAGRVAVGGEASSTNFPVVNAYQDTLQSYPTVDAFVAVFDFGGAPPQIELITDGEPFHACDTAFDWTAGKQMRFEVVTTDFPTPAVATMLPSGAVYDTGFDPPRFTWTPLSAGPFTIAFQAGTTTCTLDVTVRVDSDGDALPDLWETDGYTYEDGTEVTLTDLSAYADRADFVEFVSGADPDHRDVFVWVDWMAAPDDLSHGSHRPQAEALNLVLQSFANATSQPNPDSQPGVRLHLLIATDPVAHADVIGSGDPLSLYDWSAFDAASTMPAELTWSFHRALFAHDISGQGHSGVSREPGVGKASSDFIVSLGSFTDGVGTVSQQAGTFQHELGHNLGLGHGGGDDLRWKPNYLSLMNYLFQLTGLRVAETYGTFDFSFAALPTLSEASLDEADGLTGPGGSLYDARWDGYGTRWWYPYMPVDAPPPGGTSSESGYLRSCGEVNLPIDWNWSSQPAKGSTPQGNVKSTQAESNLLIKLSQNSRTQTLTGFDDWSNLVFTGGRIGGGVFVPLPTATPLDELTVEQARLIAPDPPGRFKVRAAGKQVVLTWKPLGPRNEWTYRVWRAVGDGAPVAIATTQSSNYQDRAAPRRADLTYTITAIDALGVESRASAALEARLR